MKHQLITWSCVAATVLLPAAVVITQRTHFAYAMDTGNSVISAESLQGGQIPESHNVTITHAAIDPHEIITRQTTSSSKKGVKRTQSTYYTPLRPEGQPNAEIRVVLASTARPTTLRGDFKGLLRDEGGERPSASVISALRESGVPISDSPILIEEGASSFSKLTQLLVMLGLAIGFPLGCLVFNRQWAGKNREADAVHPAPAEA